nr:hypothetical protein [Vulcanimicrobium alpinum]
MRIAGSVTRACRRRIGSSASAACRTCMRHVPKTGRISGALRNCFDGGESDVEIAGGGESLRGVFAQQPMDDRGELRRHCARQRFARRRRRGHVCDGARDRIVCGERQRTGQHFVQHDAEAVQIGGGGERQPLRLLG